MAPETGDLRSWLGICFVAPAMTRFLVVHAVLAILLATSACELVDESELDAEDIGEDVAELEVPRTGFVATASPTAGNERYMLDGNASTRWTTGRGMSPGNWVQIDLGAARTFDRIDMDSGASTGDYARGWEIYTSTDGASWGAAIARGTGTGQLVSATFASQSRRYVRIVQTGSSGSWWSIHELRFYTTATGPLDRTGWTATASSSASGNPPSAALDASLSSRWSTGVGMSNGNWFRVDMGASRTFSRIDLDAGASTGDYPRGYQIFASADGATWGTAIATGTGAGQVVTATFAARTARYLRIVQTGSSGSWWSIHDLRVHGSGGTPPPPDRKSVV